MQMTKLMVMTPPAEAPLSLDAIKAFLRIGHDAEDALLADLMQSALTRLEQVAGLALVVRSVRVTWAEWPNEVRGAGRRLPIAPVQQLDRVRLVDASEAETDHSDAFQLVCGRLCLRPWSRLPTLVAGARIEIDVTAGFGAATDVPEDLQGALLRLIAAMYSARVPNAFAFDHQGALPREVQAILDARKEVRL